MFRLKELRMESGLRRSEFAQKLNMAVSTIANYENETRQAPYEILILFAEYFGVSVDYLLGRTNDFDMEEMQSEPTGLLNSKERELVNIYRASSSTGKSRIIEYAKLAEKNL